MGSVFNPGVGVAPTTFTSVVGSGGNINVQPNFAVNGLNSSASCEGATGGAILNFVAGTAFGGASFAGAISGILRTEVRQTNVGNFGWASGGSFQPLSLGGGGAPNAANTGGFSIQIYAGVGDVLAVGANPGYFIGLTSTLGAITGQFSANAADAMGLICDSTAGGFATNWSWVTRRGAGAATVTLLAGPVAVTAQQLFAVGFSCQPNTDAITLTIKQLTAPGVWTTLLAPTNLTGIGAALGTRLGPIVQGQNFAAGGPNSIWFVRCTGLVDLYTVPNAFPGQ